MNLKESQIVQLSLPPDLVTEAQSAGLLSSEVIEKLLRIELVERRAAETFAAIDGFEGGPNDYTDVEEVVAEIEETRRSRRSQPRLPSAEPL